MQSKQRSLRVRRPLRVSTNRCGRQSTGRPQHGSPCLGSVTDVVPEATCSDKEIQPSEEPVQPHTVNVPSATNAHSECSDPPSATSLTHAIPEIKARTIPDIIACLTVAQSVLVDGSASKNEPSTAFVVDLLTDVLKVLRGYGHEDDQDHAN
jgi:hypothetical protein